MEGVWCSMPPSVSKCTTFSILNMAVGPVLLTKNLRIPCNSQWLMIAEWLLKDWLMHNIWWLVWWLIWWLVLGSWWLVPTSPNAPVPLLRAPPEDPPNDQAASRQGRSPARFLRGFAGEPLGARPFGKPWELSNPITEEWSLLLINHQLTIK